MGVKTHNEHSQPPRVLRSQTQQIEIVSIAIVLYRIGAWRTQIFCPNSWSKNRQFDSEWRTSGFWRQEAGDALAQVLFIEVTWLHPWPLAWHVLHVIQTPAHNGGVAKVSMQWRGVDVPSKGNVSIHVFYSDYSNMWVVMLSKALNPPEYFKK